MIRDIIDKAIRAKGMIEMVYSKDGITSKFYQLRNISYSADYGEKCINGTPYNSNTELTFRIDSIKDIQLMWNDIFLENVQMDKDGLYVVMVKGDYLIDYELRYYSKGERLLDKVLNNGERYKSDLRSIFAYHYVPLYSKTNKHQWIPFDEGARAEYAHGLYVFAYTLKDNVDEIIDVKEIPSSYGLHGLEVNGIRYAVRYLTKGCRFVDKISNDVNVLAYNQCEMYYDKNESIHCDIMREMGLA